MLKYGQPQKLASMIHVPQEVLVPQLTGVVYYAKVVNCLTCVILQQ